MSNSIRKRTYWKSKELAE